MGIANSILEAVHQELHRHPGHRAAKVGLRIGEYAGIDRGSLEFCLEALIKGTPLEPLDVEMEFCSLANGRRGDELELAYLELETAEEVAS